DQVGGVDVEEGTAGRQLGRGGDELRQVADGVTPLLTALLQQPQATDVAQVADGRVHPTLVGEVGPAAGLGQHRGVEFNADERPRARGDVPEVLPGRDADYGGCGVVGSDGHHRD